MKRTVLILITNLLLLQQRTLIQAAPPIESCPQDSIQEEDTCKCDIKLCSIPPCPYELNIAINGTDTPGSCCAIYTCDNCANETLIDEKCPCLPGATLNSKGECECVNQHHSLINGECVCDPDKCELPEICGENYVSVTVRDDCCSKTKCIRCPDDSFPTNNNDDAIEDTCVCYPCIKECGPNEKVVIMQHGNGFPGTCCDMYKCEKSNKEAKCAVGDAVYSDGEIWETPDAQMCKCQGGISFCVKNEESLGSCHKEGKVYKNNESWMLDSCTNCTCLSGETKCIAHMCELGEGRLKKPECQPLNCTKTCPEGYKLNKRGCKICKCNYSYKYDDILQKYNITKNKLEDILNDYFTHSRSDPISVTTSVISTTVATVTNFAEEDSFTTSVSSSDGCKPLTPLQWSLVGLSIAVIILIFVICIMKWLRRRKGSYDPNTTKSTIYERMNLTKDALFNNNYIGNDNKDKKAAKGSV